jgi:transposase InsO family protein
MILNLENLRRDYKTIRKENPQIGFRLEILIEFTKIEIQHDSASFMAGKRLAISALLETINISLRTIERWKFLYRGNGAGALIVGKPIGRKADELPKHIQKKIAAYRKNYRWGSEVIQAHLLRDHHFLITRFKVDRFIKISGLLDKYPVTTRKKKLKSKKQHTKVVKVDHPGIHTQMDVKYQTHLLRNSQKCYVYNFVDHASNWSFKYSYAAVNPENTEDFMRRLIDVCPFYIYRLQTDNGVEFTFKYTSVSATPVEHPLDKFCRSHGIVHKLVPPGEKELQGLVERSHRQDDQELFSRIDPFHLKEFTSELKGYYLWRNDNRRFKKLNWRTPNEWLHDYLVLTLAVILMNPPEKASGHFPRVQAKIIEFDIKKKNKETEIENNETGSTVNGLSIQKLAA